MSDITDEKLLELGRAVYNHLRGDSGWPRILVFELYDHRRRVSISEVVERIRWSEQNKGDTQISEIKFPEMYPF